MASIGNSVAHTQAQVGHPSDVPRDTGTPAPSTRECVHQPSLRRHYGVSRWTTIHCECEGITSAAEAIAEWLDSREST